MSKSGSTGINTPFTYDVATTTESTKSNDFNLTPPTTGEPQTTQTTIDTENSNPSFLEKDFSIEDLAKIAGVLNDSRNKEGDQKETTKNIDSFFEKIASILAPNEDDEKENNKTKEDRKTIQDLINRISVVSADILRSIMIEISSLLNDPSLPLEIRALLAAAMHEAQYEIRIDTPSTNLSTGLYESNLQENGFTLLLADIMVTFFAIGDEITKLEESGALTMYNESGNKVAFNELLTNQETQISRVDYDPEKDREKAMNKIVPLLKTAIEKIEKVPKPSNSEQQARSDYEKELSSRIENGESVLRMIFEAQLEESLRKSSSVIASSEAQTRWGNVENAVKDGRVVTKIRAQNNWGHLKNAVNDGSAVNDLESRAPSTSPQSFGSQSINNEVTAFSPAENGSDAKIGSLVSTLVTVATGVEVQKNNTPSPNTAASTTTQLKEASNQHNI